ncbi:MAG: hypothetical protein JXR07_04150 [Reichenbachiella sp.]
MSLETNKPPIFFWIFAIFALIWNLLGVQAYIAQVSMTPEDLAALPIDERSLFENVPAWVTGAFAIAVFAGALGCITLLWKKAFSLYIFIISLIGVLVQLSYNLFMSKALEVYGPGGFVMPIMVVIIGVALIWYTAKAEKEGWVN